MVLGLDVSTSYVGYCILENNGEFVDIGYLDLRKHKDLYEKYCIITDFAVNYKKKYKNIETIYVEAPLQRGPNAKVVALLQRWNGIFCAAIYQVFKFKPILIEHRTARKLVGVKVPKGVKGIGLKKYLLTFVRSFGIVTESVWQFKKTGNPKDFCFDMADAFIVAKAGVLSET